MVPRFDTTLSGLALAVSFNLVVTVFFAGYSLFTGYISTIQQTSDRLQPEVPDGAEFDYIIVGGGVAGCVLANRLSKNPNNKVLLLERGGDPNPFTTIPALAGQNDGLAPFAYLRETTPQQNFCGGSTERKCAVHSGHGLGGSSNINSLLNTRGSPQIYDRWSKILRDRSWRYENVLQVFKEVEDYHGYYEQGGKFDTRYHSTGGEWYVDTYDRNRTNPALDYFFKAAISAGFPLVDINNGHQARSVGVAHIDVNVKNGQRWSIYKAFLEPVLARANLKVVRYAHVTKVRFGNVGNRVTGVDYMKRGEHYFAQARKEVIISAGSIASPQLLLLSGIGPKNDLEKIGIPVQLDLPVGKGLVDHPLVPVVFSVNKTLFFYIQRDTTVGDVAEYIATGTGNLARLFSSIAAIFAKSSISLLKSKSCPDIELDFASLPVMFTPVNSDSGKAKRDYFGFYVAVSTPRSVGSIRLNTTNPLDDPLIDPAFLTHPDDVQVIVDGLRLMWNLVNTSPEFKGVDTKMLSISPCNGLPFGSTNYWRCVATETGIGADHLVGTCKMGAVVDSKLKVFGTPNLRVIDASVMPVIPNCHTTAPTVMVANMGARFIENGQS